MKLNNFALIALLVLLLPTVVLAQVVFPNRGGTGTSTAPQKGQVLVGKANGTYGPVATSTLGLGGGGGSGSVTSIGFAVPTGFSIAGFPITTSGTGTLSYATGYEGFKTASGSAWNTFYVTPSNRITAGDAIDWAGNTLNVITSGDWTGTLDTYDAADLLDRAIHTGTQLASTISDFVATVRTSISETIAGIDYNSSTGVLSLTSGYSIPLTASTTQWQTAFSWGDHASEGYITGNQTITLSGDVSGSGATSITTTVADNSHNHTSTTLSGIDISSDTNLAGDSEIVLTGDTLSIASSIARDSELHDPVTLAGARDYITLSGQEITRGVVDVSDDTNLTVAATGLNLTADAVSLASGYQIPTTTRMATWDAAYGYGNHAAQNYFDKDTDDTDDVPEGSNLYYTVARVQSALIAGYNAIFGNSTSTNHAITGNLTFDGVTGNGWSDFCVSITGAASLCDGSDASGVGSGSISTSTAVSAGNLAAWTGPDTLGQVASGTLTETVSGLEFDATRGLVGGAAVLSLTSGYSVPTTTLLSNVGTFYNTPSNRISDGTGLTWSSNTLNCDTATGSVQGCLTSADWTSFNGRVASSAINSLAEIETLTGVSNILIENDIDASSELLALMDDETGTGRLVFSASPAFSGTATFSNLTATSTLTVSGLTSALTLTDGSGNFAEYAGTSCTNQFVRSLSALGAATCATVGTADVSGLDISDDTNLTAGDALTLNGDDLDFDGGASPGGVLGGTWASPTLDDNYLFNTGDTATGDYTFTGTTTHATSSVDKLTIDNLLTFDGTTGNQWSDFCVSMTGSAGLCDGDDGGGGGSSEWTDGGTWLYPNEATDSVTIGTSSFASNYLLGLYSTTTALNSSNLLYASSGALFTGNYAKFVTSGGLERFSVDWAGEANANTFDAEFGYQFNDKTILRSIVGSGEGHGASEQDSLYLGDGAGVGWTGDGNTFIGYSVANTSGDSDYNTMVGSFVADSLEDGATDNTIMGAEAARALTTGSQNTIIGSFAGTAGTSLQSGSGNIIIGDNSGTDSASRSNTIIIGNSLSATADNQFKIGSLLSGTNVNSTGVLTVNNGLIVTNATTTNLTVSNLTSALTLTGASGIMAEYAGTSCTNQVIEDLSALGAATCVSINNGYWSGTDLSVANGGTGLSTFGGTNHVLYTTAADTLSSEAAFTYNPSTDTLTTTNLSVGTTLSFSGVGALNGVDSVDSTTITTIENAFDTVSAALETAIEAAIDTISSLTISTTLVVPFGTTCDSNADGEICHDTSDNQLIMDGLVVGRGTTKIFSVTVASTSSAFISGGLLPIPTEMDGYTITSLKCKVDGGTSKVIAVEDASANSTEDITCGTSVTADDGSITNATATADEEMYIDFGATTGSVNYVTITAYGQPTRE